MTGALFPATPATAILHLRSDEYWIGDRIEMEPGNIEPNWVLVIKAMGDERAVPVRTWVEVADDTWSGELWTDDGSVGAAFDVRPTIPTDSIRAISFSGFPRVALPLDLIAHYCRSGGEFEMYALHALSDDDGFVATMMLSAPTGLYVRYASMWHDLTDPDVVDGLNVHEVAPAALERYDARERQGQLPNVRSMLRPA